MAPLQTASLGKRLADTDVVTRNRGLKKLTTAMEKNASAFESLEDLLRVWRGLWYGLWMADKRPVQQQVAVEAVSLGSKLSDDKFILWTKAFYATLVEMWPKLDRHRMDKFLFLVRVFIAESFRRMSVAGWKASFVSSLTTELVNGGNKSIGVTLHIMRVWWDELSAEVERSETPVEPKIILRVLKAPIAFATTSAIESVVRRACEDVLASTKVPKSVRKSIAKELSEKARDAKTDQDIREILYETVEALEARK